ncbi:Uncharacterized protein Fot_10947 [Forsythia ovata]|uniref:Uncharacterized protein n=1 Tax=Forsythia ovata TaxID=205694 RepID=A0ABD1WI99_9LAMI
MKKTEKNGVDFFWKGIEHDEPQLPQGRDSDAHEARDKAGDNDDTLPNMKATGLGQAVATVDRSEHKHFVMEVYEEIQHYYSTTTTNGKHQHCHTDLLAVSLLGSQTNNSCHCPSCSCKSFWFTPG